MNIASMTKNPHGRARHSAVIVEHPRITVIESSETTDPCALEDALELFVRWAIRAHRRDHLPPAEVPIVARDAACAREESY